MFRRDTSGPMDIDSMDPMARLAEFAEPPRKRESLSDPPATPTASPGHRAALHQDKPAVSHRSPYGHAGHAGWIVWPALSWPGLTCALACVLQSGRIVVLDAGAEAHA